MIPGVLALAIRLEGSVTKEIRCRLDRVSLRLGGVGDLGGGVNAVNMRGGRRLLGLARLRERCTRGDKILLAIIGDGNTLGLSLLLLKLLLRLIFADVLLLLLTSTSVLKPVLVIMSAWRVSGVARYLNIR